MVLQVGALPSGAEVWMELVNGVVGHAVKMDSDLIALFRIEDKDTQLVKFIVKHGTTEVAKVYSLKDLVLEPKA